MAKLCGGFGKHDVVGNGHIAHWVIGTHSQQLFFTIVEHRIVGNAVVGGIVIEDTSLSAIGGCIACHRHMVGVVIEVNALCRVVISIVSAGNSAHAVDYNVVLDGFAIENGVVAKTLTGINTSTVVNDKSKCVDEVVFYRAVIAFKVNAVGAGTVEFVVLNQVVVSMYKDSLVIILLLCPIPGLYYRYFNDVVCINALLQFQYR